MKKFKISLRLPKGRNLQIQIAMVFLCIIGLMMIVSASMTTNISTQALMNTAIKQIGFIGVGYIGYLLFARYFSLELFKRFIVPLAFGMIGLLLVPLIFEPVNGAYAWIPIGDMSIQPSEFAKLGLIILFAVYLGDIRVRKADWKDIIRFPMFYFLVTFLIILIFQKDLGTAIVLFIIALFEFMMAGHKSLAKIQLGLVCCIILGSMLVLVVLSPAGVNFIKNALNLPEYMVARFENTINPFINKYGSGYQLVNGLVAFVKGNWSGVGYGKSLQKYGYLPAAKTDFILAVIAEEFGFIGVTVVVGLYFVLIYQLFKHALQSKDEKSRMILVGVGMYLFSHFVLNVGGVTALIPLTGVPLLMLSSGGSSTLSIMFSLGIAQAIIIRQKKEESV
ncbi:MAG TPA: FtsW/RodA/SpoVE family cell cycle protein [Erysipelotrichaceae bacterium]|nr:FtsW/RodA/SpoVE family cell cycle protein [Erysipelotrichaceae bacterium]